MRAGRVRAPIAAAAARRADRATDCRVPPFCCSCTRAQASIACATSQRGRPRKKITAELREASESASSCTERWRGEAARDPAPSCGASRALRRAPATRLGRVGRFYLRDRIGANYGSYSAVMTSRYLGSECLDMSIFETHTVADSLPVADSCPCGSYSLSFLSVCSALAY